MYAEERQQAIADLVRGRGRVSVTEVASAFDVTTETVRRDLSLLEKQGLLRRVHGGAVRNGAVLETQVGVREEERAAEKDRIAAAAVALLPPGELSLVLDAGSTVGRYAAALPTAGGLTVFTHALTVAQAVVGRHGIELHLLPGRVRGTTQAGVGTVTTDALARLRCDVAVLGSNGVSVRHGLSTPNPDEAAAKRAMVAAGARVVVLADSTKVGAEQTVSFADLDDVDVLVTDDRVADADVTALESAGVEVVVA